MILHNVCHGLPVDPGINTGKVLEVGKLPDVVKVIDVTVVVKNVENS